MNSFIFRSQIHSTAHIISTQYCTHTPPHHSLLTLGTSTSHVDRLHHTREVDDAAPHDATAHVELATLHAPLTRQNIHRSIPTQTGHVGAVQGSQGTCSVLDAVTSMPRTNALAAPSWAARSVSSCDDCCASFRTWLRDSRTSITTGALSAHCGNESCG